MIAAETECRRDGWVAGNWITLADGQSWCFPPPSTVPDHEEVARRAACRVVDGLVRMLNGHGIRRQGQAIQAGDPAGMSGALDTIGRALGIYQPPSGSRVGCSPTITTSQGRIARH